MTQFAANTHPGLKRDHNEDCFEADPQQGLWLVADGVGGHANGEVASAIVRETIKSDLAGGSQLVDAVIHSHRAIVEEIRSRANNNNMGSTVVAVKLSGSNYEIAWVGDSRAYLFNGELTQLTEDHSAIKELLESGAITREQAEHHPKRHVLSQSLGVSVDNAVNPGRVVGRLQPGDQLLLCSDGLTEELNDTAIAREMLGQSSVQGQVDALVNAALGAGGSDNITVVILGTPSKVARARSPVGVDMETTQNIGDAVRSNSSSRKSHDSKVWLLLALAVVAIVMWIR